MLVTRSKQLALLALLSLPLTSCDKESSAEQASQGPVISQANTEDKLTSQFRVSTRRLFENRKYDELESLAKQLRKDKERFLSGAWKIFNFYDCMDCSDKEPDRTWKQHEEMYQEWLAKYPESITAHVAYSQFYTSYAWNARSSGWADAVTEEGWKLFHERLDKASEILAKARELDDTCPMLWSVYQTLALGQGWDEEDYDMLFKAAKETEPGFHQFDIDRAYFLLPRWHGKPGQWEKDAKEQMSKNGDLRFQIFARVVTRTGAYYDNVFSECGISWPDVKTGYEELIATYPDSPYQLHSYCRLACLANDRAQAKLLFTKLGDTNSPGVWKRGEFERAKKWAMGAP